MSDRAAGDREQRSVDELIRGLEQDFEQRHCANSKRWPSLAEIARISAEIRRDWSPQRRANRWGSSQAFDTDQKDAAG